MSRFDASSSSPIPRRAVLLSAVAVAPVAAFAGAAVAMGEAGAFPAIDPRLLRLERVIAELKTAISAELDLEEDAPGYALARETADGLERDLKTAADEIFATLPRSLTDLALRARLVEYLDDRTADFLSDQDRAVSELVRAVLTMAGLEPYEKKRAVVSTIPALINALGGRYAVADKCGITVAAVVQWERDDFVPTGWEHRFACHAQKRGYKLAADLFGPSWPRTA